MTKLISAAFLAAALVVSTCVSAVADGWRAGVARIEITPAEPMWLSGYGARTHPAQGTLHPLWAKALVFEDAAGRRALLLTMDLVGVDRDFSRDVSSRIGEKLKLPRAAIALSTSHTHSGPVVGKNLGAMYKLDPRQQQLVDQYTSSLKDKLVELASSAMDDLQPAELSWAVGRATFAVNRRNNPEGKVAELRKENKLVGPVDHDVPVLAVHRADGTLRAVVAGYACHATVLDGYQWSGDWPGAAQAELERRHKGAVALFWAGCGADQNPLPRRTVELLEAYGRQLADAVDESLAGKIKPVKPRIETIYKEIDLPFGELPTRAELERDAQGDDPRARSAAVLLKRIERDGSLEATYRYPVQLWRLGSDVSWFFLGGEVVVDYALRIKQELGRPGVWVAGYSNDVMGYIPSRRVLAEGGYEGGEARFIYGLPALWSPEAEGTIVTAVRKLDGAGE